MIDVRYRVFENRLEPRRTYAGNNGYEVRKRKHGKGVKLRYIPGCYDGAVPYAAAVQKGDCPRATRRAFHPSHGLKERVGSQVAQIGFPRPHVSPESVQTHFAFPDYV